MKLYGRFKIIKKSQMQLFINLEVKNNVWVTLGFYFGDHGKSSQSIQSVYKQL